LFRSKPFSDLLRSVAATALQRSIKVTQRSIFPT
jgi:hypothetical protein